MKQAWKESKPLFAAGLFIVFFGLTALGYRSVLREPGTVLAFNDGGIEFALSPTYQFPQVMCRQWDNQFFFGNGAGQAPVTVQALGETVFGPVGFRRYFPAFILAFCGMGIYWSLRGFRLSRAVSVFAAAIAVLSAPAFHFAMVGLPVRPVAMTCAFLALGFTERGRVRNQTLPYVLGGACLGLGVSEVADVGAFYALTAGAILVWMHLAAIRSVRMAFRSAARLALLVAVSGALAFQTLSVMFKTQISGVTQGATAASEKDQYDWATQWSLPKSETWNIVSGSYYGSSMRSETAPYWGRVGRSPGWETTQQGFRNFTMTGWGISAAAALLFLAFVFTLVRDGSRPSGVFPHKALGWAALAGCVVTLMLSWGRFFPLYRLLYALPFFSTVRNPEKWNGPFTLCAVIGIALFLDHALRTAREGGLSERRRLSVPVGWAAGSLIFMALGMLAYTVASRDSRLQQLLHEGYGEQAATAVAHTLQVSWTTLLLLIAAGLALLHFLRKPGGARPVRGRALLIPLALLIAADQLYTNALYVMPYRYQALTRPNPLVQALEQAGPDRRLKLIPPRHPVLNNLRMTLLVVPGFDLFDPVSVSRLPTDYAAFFQALDTQPIRMWELGAVRYFLTFPDALGPLDEMDQRRGRFIERASMGLTVVDGLYLPTDYAAPRDRVLRLVEFTGALPLIRWAPAAESVAVTPQGEADALRKLADPEFDPARTALLHGKLPEFSPREGCAGIHIVKQTAVETRLDVNLDRPALMVRAVRYDPDWKVTADGMPLELLRVNCLFQGAVIPAGCRKVQWDYRPSLTPVWIAVSGRLGLLLVLGIWMVRSRKGDQDCA